MNTKTSVRQARLEEIDWINSCYDQVGFVHSDISCETIVVAEVNGHRAALGRLVQITSTDAELGGMLVFEEFRGLGLAGQMVAFLLQHASAFKHVFCLPYAHLRTFYEKYGFHAFDQNEIKVPKKIQEKHIWCNQTYDHTTLLLVLRHSGE